MLPLDMDAPGYGYRPVPSEDPAVSIITPYYNTGPIFLDTVRSVLRQSLQQWEWLIVNDGSTDADALRVLLPLRSADCRVRVIDQPNAGLAAARNAGVAASRAPLLFFLDSDDLLAPTALEKLAWTLVSRPGSAFATAWNTTFGHERIAWPRGFDTRYAFLHESMATALTMVRRAAFEQIGGFDETMRHGLEDYEFWLRGAAKGLWGHDIPEYLLHIRRKAPSDYQGYGWAARDDVARFRAFHAEMRRRHPDLFRHGLPRLGGGAGLLDTHATISAELPFQNPLQPVGQRRVLLLLPWLRVGGADRFALDLVEGLAARGDRVSVCLLRGDVAHEWAERLGRHTSDVFDLGAFLAPADIPRFLHYLVQSRQISHVLLSNSLLAYQLLPYLRSRCPGVAFLDFLHMEEEGWRDGGFPRAAIEHTDLLDVHVVNSEHLRRWMVGRGGDVDRIAVCTVNTDTAQWRPSPELRAAARAGFGLADAPIVIAFVGRLVPQKRPRLAADVLLRLRERGLPFVALVAGDGEDMPWLRRFVRRHGLGGSVRLLGALPPERVRDVLAAADLLLLPSENEALALVAQEAMAMEVVPVAAEVGGMAELITPECGVLVTPGPGETERYADAIVALTDPARRAALGRAGRTRMVSRFDLRQMIERMEWLLDDAAERAQNNPRAPVSPGQGLAAATLAIEHHQLETRLRGLLPVRLALGLRRSSGWGALGRLRSLTGALERLDRTLYAARRETMRRLRALR